MTSRVIYTGDLRTNNIHERSGSEFQTDAPVDNHGKGERFSPTDLVATSLAACMLTTIGIAASIHGFDITGAECEVEKIMVADPRRIGEIKIAMSFPIGKTYTEKEQRIIEHAAKNCPVLVSLHPDLVKTLDIKWSQA